MKLVKIKHEKALALALELIQQPPMGYRNLSDTKVIIFYQAKLSGIYETKGVGNISYPMAGC